MTSPDGSIFDLIGQPQPGLDPTTMGLLGAAGGFANAAMPQPYKGGTPWGAVLGQGAAGLGAGYGQALRNAQTQAQTTGQQISNVGAASGLPLTVARNKMLSDVYGNPALIQQLMSPQGGAQPGGGAAPGPTAGAPNTSNIDPARTVSPALSSITDPNLRSMAVKAALSANLPLDAYAPWIAAVHNETGWNASAPDNKNPNGTHDVGIGQINSSNFGHLGLTEQQLRDPATNLSASARIFGEQWAKNNGDVGAALAGYNGSGPAAQDYAARAAVRLKGWGYPNVPPTAPPTDAGTMQPSDALGMAQQYESQANRVEMAKSLGLPMVGDPAALRTAAQQYRTLALAGPQAQAQAQAKADVEQKTAGPIQLQKTLNTNVDLRQGGMTLLPDGKGGWTVAKNPELREVEGPTGQKTFVHVNPASPFAAPGTPGEASPVLGPNGQPAVAAIPPQVQSQRTEAGNEFMGKEQDQYQAAQNTQAWLNQIDHAASVMKLGGPGYMTGPFAPQRYALMSMANDLGRSFKVKESSLFDQPAVASWEEMKKATNTAGFELSSHYEGHARQAAQTIQTAMNSVPAETNSPQGLQLVSAGIREGSQSAIDSHEYKQLVNNATQGAGLTNAETDFYKAHPATQYANRAISNITPFTIKGPDEFQKYLPGTFVTDGKTVDPATGRPKVVQVPPRVDTIGGIQFPLNVPAYIQKGAPNGQ